MIPHTFFNEGKWLARGFFFDEQMNAFAASGDTIVKHEKDLWVNIGHMHIEMPTPVIYEAKYEIVPFKQGQLSTTWAAANVDVGKLVGTFVVVGDTILSIYKTEGSGPFSGAEILKQSEDGEYEARGALLRDGVRISSWTFKLTRQE